MSVLSGVNKDAHHAGRTDHMKDNQQGVSHTQSHDLRGNALPSSMSHPCAKGCRPAADGDEPLDEHAFGGQGVVAADDVGGTVQSEVQQGRRGQA